MDAIIYNPLGDKDLIIDAQKIALFNNWKWIDDETVIWYSTDIRYLVFIYDEKTFYFLHNRPLDVLKIDIIDVVKSHYAKKILLDNIVVVDNITVLENYIKNGVKTIDSNLLYNTNKELVYENTKVIKFNDFDNLEYRKGSSEFGDTLTRLLEFLRLYKKGINDIITFKLSEFEEKSNISLEDIKKLINSKSQGSNLYDFNIDLNNDNITFSKFYNGKNRPFESNNY